MDRRQIPPIDHVIERGNSGMAGEAAATRTRTSSSCSRRVVA